MKSHMQVMTKRFEIKVDADETAAVVVDLNHDDFQAVMDVLHKLVDASKTLSYGPGFHVNEVDAEGRVKRELLS